jgi:hypothetical protein
LKKKNLMVLPVMGLVLMNLSREACMRSTQQLFETWESSEHLLEERRKPVSRRPELSNAHWLLASSPAKERISVIHLIMFKDSITTSEKAR